MKRLIAAAALVAACGLTSPAARADDDLKGAFAASPAAAPLADAALKNQRGRYVPPAPTLTGAAPQRSASADGLRAVTAAGTTSSAAAGAGANLRSAGGSVVYFGFDLSSAWTTHGAGGATTYTAGEDVGIDLSGARPSVTVRSWTARQGSGAAPAATGSISGSAGDGRIEGVAQTIQIAGNGNSVVNGASLDVSAVRPALVVGPANSSTCGSACSVRLNPTGIGVAIDLPGGSVSQGIAGGSLYQNVQVTSDANAITNQLKLSLQVTPGGSHAVSAPLNLIPPTLQLAH